MALDLKIHIFAFYHFFETGKNITIESFKKLTFLNFGDECTQDKSYTDAFDIMFYKAIFCRYFVFFEIYQDEIDLDAIKFESLSDFEKYVNLFFDYEYLFGDLNVFERLFATCALANHLFCGLYQKGRADILKYRDYFWAMYFDKFADEFYKEGGWNELKKLAKTYDLVYDFMCLYPREQINLSLRKEALENYRQFKNIVELEHCSKKNKAKIHISLLWIKYQTVHFNYHVTILSNYADYAENSDVEQLLQGLKLVLNFYPQCDNDNCKISEDKLEGKYSAEMQYFETLHNSEESKTEDDLRIQNLTVNEEFCEKNSNAKSNFKTEHQSETLTSGKKEVGCAIMNKRESFETADFETGTSVKKMGVNLEEYSHNVNDTQDRIEIPRFKTDIENSMKPSDLELNHDYTNITFDKGKKVLDGISSGNVGRQSEATNPDNGLSTNKKDGSEWFEQVAPKNASNPRDFNSEDENFKSYRKDRGYSENLLDQDFGSKSEKMCNKKAELISASTVSKTEATVKENEITERNLYSTKEVLMVNDGKMNSDIELENLRAEQKDPEMINFLRMILVLGDRQGIRHVRETLQSNEDEKNSSKKSKKKNKRKNKSGK